MVDVASVACEPSAEAAAQGSFVVRGRVKWFDATRGFGFLVSDQCEGDVLIHFSVLAEHGRRSVPEGTEIECHCTLQPRGLQVTKVTDIDLTRALPSTTKPVTRTADREDRAALDGVASEFIPVEVKSLHRSKGYAFLVAPTGQLGDIFIHYQTLRRANMMDLEPGDHVEARVAESRRGLTAVDVRPAT